MKCLDLEQEEAEEAVFVLPTIVVCREGGTLLFTVCCSPVNITHLMEQTTDTVPSYWILLVYEVPGPRAGRS